MGNTLKVYMASQDIKDFLFDKTGVAVLKWKRLSKTKTPQGEVRIFENKQNGTQIQTLESPSGVLSILETGKELFIKQVNDTGSNLKKAKALVLKYLQEGTEPDEKKAGYALISSLFKFSFMQDANPDHSEHLEMAAAAGNPSVAVTGFNIFITPKTGVFEDYSFDHLEPLLCSFLPDFLEETEESSFCIQ